MNDVAGLLSEYREALSAAMSLASAEEQPLYVLHAQSLEQLTLLLSAQGPTRDIARTVARERRAFGWSFLPGTPGERVETAFHALASELERSYPNSPDGA